MKKNKLFLLLIFSPLILCCQSTAKENQVVSGEMPAMVYPKYRQWMSPDHADIARFTSPSLQWPSKKSQIFEVRVAKDKNFTKEVIHLKDIPFSMINLHKELSSGLWYWQYKARGHDWSQVASFDVNDDSIDFVPPSFTDLFQSIPRSHPRLMVKKEQREQWRQKVMTYKESAQILEKAKEVMSQRIPSERDATINFLGRDDSETDKIKKIFSKEVGYSFGKSLKTLTQAYLLTQEKKYFDSALNWMREAATWDPEGLTRINDFGDALIMESLALAADAFWDRLESKDRKAVLQQVLARGNGFYEKWTNYLENRNSSMHVWQHILHRLFITSIVVLDELPDAVKWLEYIYELWLAQHPKMAAEDGAWFNGTGYMRMNVMTLLDIPMKLGAYTGHDYFKVPWYRNFMKWMTYAYPPGATSDGFCNDGKKWPIPNSEYGAFADAYARITGDPRAQLYSKAVFTELNQLQQPLINSDYTGGPMGKASLTDDMDYAWFRITQGYDMPLPATDKTVELPASEIFPDVGVAYLNTNRKDKKNNLRISVKSSPMGPLAHTHAEHNTFNIAYQGKRLFYNTGYRPWMGAPHTQAWYKHTRGHNGVLVDNHGQPYDAGAYGFLPRFIRGEQLTYVVGDASHAYQAHELPSRTRKDNTPNDLKVKFFRRHYLLLKPNLFVVYDEMEADKAVDWSWLIHNYHGLKLNPENKTVETTYEDRGGQLTLFGGAELDFSLTDKFSVEPKNVLKTKDAYGNLLTYNNHWHFKASTQKKRDKMRFLAIIQVREDLNYELVSVSKNGQEFEVGDWIINANLDTTTPGIINLRNKQGTVQFHSNVADEGGVSKLVEEIDGKKIIKTVKDTYPKSIISAAKRFK
ncbi:MAG: DUF4962 domain-containing protein [Flavobacteriaceae bacterium]|jgi:hypothetical protein